MKFSMLSNLLFSSGIATEGYDFQVVPLTEHHRIIDEITTGSDANIVEGPSLTFVEVPSQKTIWLITGQGHFAHPSILKRSLSDHGKTRVIQVSGITAGAPDVMYVWMAQFREQDAQASCANTNNQDKNAST